MDRAKHRTPRRFFISTAQGEVHFRGDGTLAIKSRIQPAGQERSAKKQSGAEEQSERKRDLRHDEQVPRREKAIEPSDMRRFADLLF
jgi:hypothetical protein